MFSGGAGEDSTNPRRRHRPWWIRPLLLSAVLILVCLAHYGVDHNWPIVGTGIDEANYHPNGPDHADSWFCESIIGAGLPPPPACTNGTRPDLAGNRPDLKHQRPQCQALI